MSRNDVFLAIRKYATTNYIKLDIKDFVLGDAPYNRRCHLNAVQKIKEGKASKVFLCFAIDKDNNSQCVHFINELKDGTYQDNTWGWLYENSEYYIIKEVKENEYSNIGKMLMDTKETLLNLNSNWFQRFYYKISKSDI